MKQSTSLFRIPVSKSLHKNNLNSSVIARVLFLNVMAKIMEMNDVEQNQIALYLFNEIN